ncbi:MAG: lasso peptide biosynthesis B2 protein [Cyanobacteria bacterium J06639_16]
MKQLYRFFRLSSGDRQLLIKTFILLSLIRLGLWLLPFQRLRQFLDLIRQGNRQASQIQPTDPDKIITAVNISSRYMPGGEKCLARALTTQTLMFWHGYSPQLHLGVTKGEQGEFEAHAWVEHQGQVVIGYLADLSRFTPLYYPFWKGVRL